MELRCYCGTESHWRVICEEEEEEEVVENESARKW